MKAKLIVNSAEVELGFKDLEWIAEFLEDTPRNIKIYEELAKSESYAIRVAVASKKCINEGIFQILIQDKSTEVLRVLVGNTSIEQFLNRNYIEKLIITKVPEIYVNLIERLFDLFLIVDGDWLCEMLIQNDVSVRYSLAKNHSTPTFVLRELAGDRDINVALQANQNLKEG